MVAESRGIRPHHRKLYCLFEDKDKQFDDNKVFSTFKLPAGSTILFLERPLPIRVEFSGKEESFVVFWSSTVNEIITTICQSMGLNRELYSLDAKKGDKDVGLFPWSHLKDENVDTDTTFLLKKKDGDSSLSDSNIWEENKKALLNKDFSQQGSFFVE